MIPLKIHLLAHPASKPGMALAEALRETFTDPPASGGLRVPVLFTPDRGDGAPPGWEGEHGIDLDRSRHTLVVVLADARMTRRVMGGTGASWEAFLAEGYRRAPVGASPHAVFGVAVGGEGFQVSGARHMLRTEAPPEDTDDREAIAAWVASVVEDLALELFVEAIALLDARVARMQGPPVRLFLSHAKADLRNDDRHVLRILQKAIRDLPIEGWFDAAEIPPASEFGGVIEDGVKECSIVAAILTDEYASRPWCQREILTAKKYGVPIVVIDALKHGEPRSFPYIGNLPTVRAVPDDAQATARRLLGRAAREALRTLHNLAQVEAVKDDGEIPLATAPEAVTLVHHAKSTEDNQTQKQRFLYPDPPLTRQELEVLLDLRPDASFTTPLTKVARRTLPEQVSAVALSISNSDDLGSRGLSAAHEATLSDEIHLYLLLAGLQVAYGGALSGDFGTNNFTLRLFELVRSYSSLAEGAGTELRPILNYAPWPLRLGYGDKEANLFGKVADLIEGDVPPVSEVSEPIDALFPMTGNGFRFAAKTSEQRLAWTRGLTLMRARMTREVQARVVIGGRMDRYSGLYPGVVEEAWMSLITGQPLYLVGGFGGAASAVIEVLQAAATGEEGVDGISAQSGFAERIATNAGAAETLDLAARRGLRQDAPDTAPAEDPLDFSGRMVTPARMAADIAEAGGQGMAVALANGLDEDQNRTLFQSIQAEEIATLILTGLGNL